APCGRAARQRGHREGVDLAGVATSGGANFDGRTIFYVHRRLRVLVLVSDHAATVDRLDRRATNLLGGGGPVLPRPDRHARAGMEFRSNARTPLALRDSTINERDSVGRLVFRAAQRGVSGRRFHLRRIWHYLVCRLLLE